MWGCGLKWIKVYREPWADKVILRVRMWIEMVWSMPRTSATPCHPPCEDVDWNSLGYQKNHCMATSSSVWGCGLKFCALKHATIRILVILRVRMWIEIKIVIMQLPSSSVILRVRMWIEIGRSRCATGEHRVILRVRMWIEIFTETVWDYPVKVILRVRMWIEIAWFRSLHNR